MMTGNIEQVGLINLASCARCTAPFRVIWLREIADHLILPSFMALPASLETVDTDTVDCTPSTFSMCHIKRFKVSNTLKFTHMSLGVSAITTNTSELVE